MIRRTRMLEFPVWTPGPPTFMRVDTIYEMAQCWKIGGPVAICYIERSGKLRLPLLPSLEAELREEFANDRS